jgi:hypothetical protein
MDKKLASGDELEFGKIARSIRSTSIAIPISYRSPAKIIDISQIRLLDFPEYIFKYYHRSAPIELSAACNHPKPHD